MEAATCLPLATQEGHNSTQSPHNLLIEPDYATHVWFVSTLMWRRRAVFLTFWPLWGGGRLKEKTTFQGYRKATRKGSTAGAPGAAWGITGCGCGLLGVSLIVKEAGTAARLQSSPMDHCGRLFSGLCCPSRFHTDMPSMKAKKKLGA